MLVRDRQRLLLPELADADERGRDHVRVDLRPGHPGVHRVVDDREGGPVVPFGERSLVPLLEQSDDRSV
jgi:hypothetical protein